MTMKDRNAQAAEILRRLDEIGAINLNVLIEKAAEIKDITTSIADVEPGDICYKFIIRIGPPRDFDLVTVANDLRQLGFQIQRVIKQ